MNFYLYQYVMMVFVVLNLVNESKALDYVEDAVCSWDYNENLDTGKAHCNDGIYTYLFQNNQCHIKSKSPGQPTEGVDCKDPVSNSPVSDVTCDWYKFRYFPKNPKADYVDCTHWTGPSNAPGSISQGYNCGSLNNIRHCKGVPLDQYANPKITK